MKKLKMEANIKNKKGNAFLGIILGIVFAVFAIIILKVMFNIDLINYLMNLLSKTK